MSWSHSSLPWWSRKVQTDSKTPSEVNDLYSHTHFGHFHKPVNKDREGNESDGDVVWNTVYHQVPLHLLSICQVNWGTAAMTFDLGTEQQGEKVINVRVLVLNANYPDSAGTTPPAKQRKWLKPEEKMGMSRILPSQTHALSLDFSDHVTVAGEQTVHGCLPCLSVVL